MQPNALNCPNCGAPLTIDLLGRHTVCLYCNSSIRLIAGPGEDRPTRTIVLEVPPEVGEQVKQLILDGKRAEAITYYSEKAGLTIPEAETAVNQLAIPLVYRLMRQMTLKTWAVIVYPLVVLLLAAGMIWALVRALNGQWGFVLLALLLAWLTWNRLMWTVPKLISTWVATFGTRGRARILKLATISPALHQGGTLVTALLEVQPEQDGSPFHDEETWLIRNESLPKVSPGNTILVRYDGRKQDRVFPISPIKVWDEDKRAFV